MTPYQEFISYIRESIRQKSFVKMTLSNPVEKGVILENIYVRLIQLKNIPHISFTYHYTTNDQVQNRSENDGLKELESLIQGGFRSAFLFTTQKDLVLQTSKKGTITLQKKKASFPEAPAATHDRQKMKRAHGYQPYLQHLGIMDVSGELIPKMADKFRQINKYLEIIEGLIQSVSLPEHVHIVDMGSGKGYLTFALYEYLKHQKGLQVTITGIELRLELVNYCNDLAHTCGFNDLNFICQPIEAYTEQRIDILIALHACDTATDDAIYKGIVSKASLIICAPCCHKQIRQQVKGIEQESPLLKYGIFKERQFEMVTDTIRALIMEQHHYQTNIFEFISNEHTRKNVMLVGAKSHSVADAEILRLKINALKAMYSIDKHYLETLLKK